MTLKILISLLIFLSSIKTGAQKIIDSLIIEDHLIIEFASDKHDVSDSLRNKIRQFLSNDDDLCLYQLKAHTDSDGSIEYNYDLSKKRNQEVKLILIEFGINDHKIKCDFYGEDSLLVKEYNEEIKIKNRRVEIHKFKNKKFISLSGRVLDFDNSTGLEAEMNLNSPTHITSIRTDSSGSFKTWAPIDEELQIDILSKGFFVESRRLKLNKNSKTNNMLFKLREFKLNDKQRLDNLNFEGNTHVLLESSLPHLETLKNFMLLNDKTCIELAGHINMPNIPPLARHTESFGLSIARSTSLFNRLEKIGISKDRMLARGYGNTYMLFPKAISQKEQSANRRVELIISDCDSTELISNDLIKDLSIYDYNSPMDRKFDKNTLVRDIGGLPKELKKEIITVVKNLEINNKNPTDFTYKQLLLKFKELK